MSKTVQALYDRRAAFYSTVMHALRDEVTRRHLQNALPPTLPANARIFDIGCGSGLLAPILLERYPDAEIIGCDYATKLLAIHQQKFPSVRLIQGDFNDMTTWKSFPDGQRAQLPEAYCDLIVSAGALSEYGDLARALPVCHRLLKPQGHLVNIGIERNGWGYLVGLLWHFIPRGAARFIRACQQAGFREVAEVPGGKSGFGKHWSEFVVRAEK